MKNAAIILNHDFNVIVKEEDVFCADGGYNYAKAKGLKVKAVIGDLDSAKDIEEGVETVKFNRKKDMTDGELAIRYAISMGYNKLSIYGAEGGRLDHIMFNIILLGIAGRLGCSCVIRGEGFDAYYVKSSFELNTEFGDIISIVPFSDSINISSTEGLEYEIKNRIINKYLTLGISNVALGNKIAINLIEGEAIIFRIYRKEE